MICELLFVFPVGICSTVLIIWVTVGSAAILIINGSLLHVVNLSEGQQTRQTEQYTHKVKTANLNETKPSRP